MVPQQLSEEKPIKVITLQRRTAAIIVGLLFTLVGTTLGTLAWSIQQNHERDQQICLGANRQISRAVDKLTEPLPINPAASEADRRSTEIRNQATAARRVSILAAIEQIRKEECDPLKR